MGDCRLKEARAASSGFERSMMSRHVANELVISKEQLHRVVILRSENETGLLLGIEDANTPLFGDYS